MTDESIDIEVESKKPAKKQLIISLLIVLLGLGAGYGLSSQNVFSQKGTTEPTATPTPNHEQTFRFVPIPTIIVTLTTEDGYKYLKFTSELEVPDTHVNTVSEKIPRIIDTINTYLRALEVRDLERPGALFKIQSQLLGRLNTATGKDHINDILITEYVIN